MLPTKYQCISIFIKKLPSANHPASWSWSFSKLGLNLIPICACLYMILTTLRAWYVILLHELALKCNQIFYMKKNIGRCFDSISFFPSLLDLMQARWNSCRLLHPFLHGLSRISSFIRYSPEVKKDKITCRYHSYHSCSKA